MVNRCQSFVETRNLKFGTNPNPTKSKTKCVVFSKKKSKIKPMSILLNDDVLPWVTEVFHLGSLLQADNSMRKDITRKRCIFNNKCNSLLQEFYAASPSVIMKCINTYASSFPSSQLWNVDSNESERLYKSWNVLVRQVFGLDRKTHRSLIEPVSKVLHLKTMLCSRMVKFSLKLRECPKFTTRFLANMFSTDLRVHLEEILHTLPSYVMFR